MMKAALRSKWWLVMLGTLAFGLVFAAPAFADISTGTFQITLVDEAGMPLANYPADYPAEMRNLQYEYRYGGTWAPSVSFQTDAGGQATVAIDPAHLGSWDKKVTIVLNQTSREQDVRLNTTFQAAKVNVNLTSCTGPITALPGGTVAQGGGFWYTHGTTGPTGTVSFYAFPATVKVRMDYNHKSPERSQAIVAGTNEIDFQTTKVTLTYPGDIKSNTGGSWWAFSKPSMDLLPGTYNFYFLTGSVWSGPVPIAVSGCELFYPPLTNLPPEADAGGPYTGVEGSPVTLDASGSSDPDGDPLTYAWDLDDDGQHDDAVGPSPTWTFPDDGAFPVAVQVTDDDGATDTATATVTVSNVAPTVGPITAPLTPLAVGTSFNVSAPFTDPGVLDTHSAVWDWGDGSPSAGVVSESGGSGSVSGTHVYAAAGVYTLTLTVTDKDGGSTSAVYEFVVAYDPSAGFVTGGGWIDSPVGAYAANPALVGKATFGFVAKYKKGATVPDGNTQFQFKAGDLNFKSTSYEWLVVAGKTAKFKGEGTINGQGSYKFMISGVDASPDTFRIQIWGDDGVVYDNGSQQALGGGSIVVHN